MATFDTTCLTHGRRPALEPNVNSTNVFHIHGKLVRDVRRGSTAGGVATAFYVVAVARQSRVAHAPRASTDFIPITTYGAQAESDLRCLAKGSEVAIRGRIRSWYDAARGRGGFCFEPDPGGVRYTGAPVDRAPAVLAPGEHAAWLRDYDAALIRYDAAPRATRPARSSARV
jgi:single-strand DNA-binding protein